MKHTKAIVYIITKLELGGAQKVCLSLLRSLEQHDIPVFLISGTHGPLVKKVINKQNVFLLPHLKRKISLKNIWHDIRAFFHITHQLRTLKKKYPYLIVHTHSTKAGILGRWAAWCVGIQKRIHTIHGFAFHDHQSWISWLPIFFIERITYFITSHFVCVSSHDVKTGIRLFPGFAHKHSIIRAAVDTEQFFMPARKSTLEDTQQFIFGSISCFKPQKNISDLLRAFHQVYQSHPKARLELIGDGYLRPTIEQWISDHQLNSVITLHGWQNTVAPRMRNWHAFVLSSLWEGLPCAVIEARLLKLPIISYNTGGISDIITHQENGLLAEPKNWRQLAQYMNKLITDSPLYTKLHTHQDDLSDFYISAMVEKHIQLYH